MEVLRSALKHGCSLDDIRHALMSSVHRRQVGAAPRRWLYIGLDAAARPLEIVTVEGDDGVEVVIHAMKLRKSYYPGGGRP